MRFVEAALGRTWGRPQDRLGTALVPRSLFSPCLPLCPPPGEKLLKSLISRTPEWRDREARLAAACACESQGYSSLGRVLRGFDTSAALRKKDMLFVARFWHYRSLLWRTRAPRRRGETGAHSARTDSPPEPAPKPAPAPPLLPSSSQVVPPVVGQPLAPARVPSDTVIPTAVSIALPGYPPFPALILCAAPPGLKAALAKGALPSMLMAPEHAFPREGVPPAQTHAVDGLPDLQAVLDGMGSAAAAV